MQASDFITRLIVDQTSEEAFNAITNVRGWWSEEIEGDTAKLNDELTYHYEDVHYSQIKLIEVIPNKKVVWFVKYNYFKFTKDKGEWTGTKMSFEIAEKGGKTEIMVTHHDWFQNLNVMISAVLPGRNTSRKFKEFNCNRKGKSLRHG
jgi:hypothetical protein